ncbi:MAG: LacI family DNA-binding transcriptional regulator [Clostridia bacterium]|nr:LacI family DNA-binding transcriptional regulator [Clostridia bacterium]
MVTLKQIASVCGVSVASVSKALNHASDISAETTERIIRTARELGYYPNAVARALKTNRTYSIGVLFEDDTHCGLTHEYFSHVLNAVKNEAESRGYDVTFISQNLGRTAMSFLEHCKYRNCDGVVIANVDFTDPTVTELVASEIPVVTIDYLFDNRSAVLSDNAQGMHDLVNYVYSMGHRRIAFIHGELTAVTRSRLASFHKTASQLGLDVPDSYVRTARYHDPRQSGLATRELLALKKPPTCILYPDDVSLLGGMTEIERSGLSVPGDISIAGYDGIPMSQLLRPILTTLRQDSEELGAQAARLLIEAIEQPKTYLPQLVMIPGSVQKGGTVGQI